MKGLLSLDLFAAWVATCKTQHFWFVAIRMAGLVSEMRRQGPAERPRSPARRWRSARMPAGGATLFAARRPLLVLAFAWLGDGLAFLEVGLRTRRATRRRGPAVRGAAPQW